MRAFVLKSRIEYLFVIIIFLFLINGCASYRYASDFNNLPGEIKSISIPFFKNETFESNIEASFTNALVNEFIKNKKFTVLPQGGDATLLGVVKDFQTATIAYSREDRVLEYRAFVTLDLTLRNNQTGEIIWRRPNFIHDEEYTVATDIAFTEASEQVALKKIAIELAEQIYEELVLGF